MPVFPSFAKELLSNAVEEKDDEVEGDEEKTELVITETGHDGEDVNLTSAPPVDATAPTPPRLTAPMTQSNCEINKLINDLTKSYDEEGEVPINMLKRKQRYKHAA
ncbi:hypothetical protein J1N35_025831 [Gossypium stocksii]|uniref:Uncharacterized protein n=1 Tax=Gossypium stocksii TaxID=47602 RepID=A0A9D3ZYM9_9ROSI|nr:hypothetical protein J1N35_025831 [Gossypium stocksii]